MSFSSCSSGNTTVSQGSNTHCRSTPNRSTTSRRSATANTYSQRHRQQQQQQQQRLSPSSSWPSSKQKSDDNEEQQQQEQQQQQQQQQCLYFLPFPSTTLGRERGERHKKRQKHRGLFDEDSSESESESNDDDHNNNLTMELASEIEEEWNDSSLTTNFSSSSDAIPSRPVFQNLEEVLGGRAAGEGRQNNILKGHNNKYSFYGRTNQNRPRHTFISNIFGNHHHRRLGRNSTNILSSSSVTLGYVKTIIRHGDPVGSLSRQQTTSTLGAAEEQQHNNNIPSRLLLLQQKQCNSNRWKQHSLNLQVPFANERTLLDWFQWAVLMSGFSFALSSFNCRLVSHNNEPHQPIQHQIYGLMLMPLAIVILCHSMMQCTYNARRYRFIHDGHKSTNGSGNITSSTASAMEVLYDTNGPIVFGSLFMLVTLLATIFGIRMNDNTIVTIHS